MTPDEADDLQRELDSLPADQKEFWQLLRRVMKFATDAHERGDFVRRDRASEWMWELAMQSLRMYPNGALNPPKETIQ